MSSFEKLWCAALGALFVFRVAYGLATRKAHRARRARLDRYIASRRPPPPIEGQSELEAEERAFRAARKVTYVERLLKGPEPKRKAR